MCCSRSRRPPTPPGAATCRRARVSGARRRTLVLRIRRVPGQRVTFYDRVDGAVKRIGKPTSRRRDPKYFRR